MRRRSRPIGPLSPPISTHRAGLTGLVGDAACDGVAALHDGDDGFRGRVVMARHDFGRGEYRYFSYPLPPIIQDLRTRLYAHLAPIANRWHERMGIEARSWIASGVPRSLPGRRPDTVDSAAVALWPGD